MKLTKKQKTMENRKVMFRINKLRLTFGILFVITALSVISLLGLKQGFFSTTSSLADTSEDDWSNWASLSTSVDGNEDNKTLGVTKVSAVNLTSGGTTQTDCVNLDSLYTWDSIVQKNVLETYTDEESSEEIITYTYQANTSDVDLYEDGYWVASDSDYTINPDDINEIQALSSTIIDKEDMNIALDYWDSVSEPGEVYFQISKDILTYNSLEPTSSSWIQYGASSITNANNLEDQIASIDATSTTGEFYIYVYIHSSDIESKAHSVVRVYKMQLKTALETISNITLTTQADSITLDGVGVEGTSQTALNTNTSIYTSDSVKFDFTTDSVVSSVSSIKYLISGTYIESISSDALVNTAIVNSSISCSSMAGTGEFYIYAQLVPNSADGAYLDGEIVVYKVEEIGINNDTISATIDGDSVSVADIGKEVVLSSTNTVTTDIYYSEDAEISVTEIYESEVPLGIDVTNADINVEPTQASDGNYYFYYRYRWYKVTTTITKYIEEIEIPDSIRTNGQYSIYAFGIPTVSYENEQGNNVWLEIIEPSLIANYSLELDDSVGNVKITDSSSSSDEDNLDSTDKVILEAGDYIYIEFEDETTTDTTGWEIFYTFSQSTPVVSVTTNPDGTGYITQAGNSVTKKYDIGKGIEITDDMISAGSSLYITAIGVYYNSETGKQLLNNSDITTAIYYFDDLPDIGGTITASPTTSATEITGVSTGDYIRLTIEPAENSITSPTIFYTIDGTEPLVSNVNGVLSPASDSTMQYSSVGVQVPTATTDSLFTITAVLCQDGYANSEIYRFTYQYPDSVSVPYATPTSGVVTENTLVTLSSATEGAIIYYEIAYDGSEPAEPTISSAVFSADSPLLINSQTWIKAFASGTNGISNTVSFQYTMAGKLSVPTPSISSGSVVSNGTLLTLSGGDTGLVYYTTDGTDPSDLENASVLIGNTVILSGDPAGVVTVRTCSIESNMSTSDIGSYTYTISSFVGGVFADIETESTVENGATISLYTDVTNPTIYYTTDGTMPTSSSSSGTTVTATGEFGGTFNIKAMALPSGGTQATEANAFTYTLMSKLKSVVADVPTGAIFTEVGTVSLSATVGTIYYTLDGTDPTIVSSLYTEPIEIDEATTIKAFATEDGFEDSDVKEFTYSYADQVVRPSASASTGEVDLNQEITFTTTTSEATIYYTTNGTQPSLSDPDSLQTYTGPITITKAATYSVMAVKDGMENSEVLTLRYTVREPVVEEVASIVEGTAEETTSSSRLQSRSTYSDTSGPTYSDIVLKNITYGAVISGEYGSVQADAQLSIEKMLSTEVYSNMVKQRLGDDYDFVANYDIKLLVAGEEVQPDGTIEIGIPIPSDYENAMIYIVHVADDGTMEMYDTRRSNGVAYAMVNHLSMFGIVAPVLTEEVISYTWLIWVSAIGASLMIGIGVILFRRVRKNQYKNREY